MANHGAATALLLIASLLVAVALSGADARLTAVHRDANGGFYVLEKAKAKPKTPAAAVPQLTCSKVHGVQAGETCFSVGQGAGLTGNQFLGFNPNINCDDLFIGQWVCLKATPA